MKMNKKVLACLLCGLAALLAIGLILFFTVKPAPAPSQEPEPTVAEETAAPKLTAPAVSDLAVSPNGIATFTHAEGMQYQLLVDGKVVSIRSINGQYDIYQYVCDGQEHTITVRSVENDIYQQSKPGNAVKVKVPDASAVSLTYDSSSYTFTFTEVSGFTYSLLVNGQETELPENRNIQSLIPENMTAIIDLLVKSEKTGDVVFLNARLNILTITYHHKITDFRLQNGTVSFTALPGFTYALYQDGKKVLEDVSSGTGVEEILRKATGTSAVFHIKITGDAEKNSFVLEENRISNEAVAKFLKKPYAAVGQSGGKITLRITDSGNAGIAGVHYQIYVDNEIRGTATEKINDISQLFTQAGTVTVQVQAMAEGYYGYNSISDPVKVVVPDYNRFHYQFDSTQASVGGIVSDNRASITVSSANVPVQTNVTVDLTKANIHKTLIAIENPSDRPAGILSLQVDIVSASDPGKFIRIHVASNNVYNTHVYGGYGDSLLGSLRKNHELVDASYGQIVDYNVLWSAFMLGTQKGDYGFEGWDTTQKMPLVLVYDSGKLGYFTPDGKSVWFADLQNAEGFDVNDFAQATLRYTVGDIKASSAAGFQNATYRLDFFGTGRDLTGTYFVGSSGLKLKSLETNGTNGVYLFVAPFNTADVNQGSEEWIAMGGTLTTGKLTINGVPYELAIKYSGMKNRLYVDFAEHNSLLNAAAFLGETVYLTLPASGTLTGNWTGTTWRMVTTYRICSTPVNGAFGQWQLCTHRHTNGLPDMEKLPGRVSAVINAEQNSQNYIYFTMAATNGFEADNWDTFVVTPEGAKYNGNALQIKRAGGGTGFHIEGSDRAAVGDILVFPAGEYYNEATDKGITLDQEYRLKWTGEAWAFTDEEYVPPVVSNRVSATINDKQDNKNYIFFTMSQNNGFEAENWDTFVVTPEGAKYNGNALQIKRAGPGMGFYIEGSNLAAVGDILVFPAGEYYNEATDKGITLDQEYRLKWNGTDWEITTEGYTPPATGDFTVTMSQTVKRHWWWGFEMFLEGTGLSVGPQNGTVALDGEVLLDGEKLEEPWLVVSDYDWGTGSYTIIIKTSDGKVWADENAYNADKAAGTVHQITVKAGTKLTTSDGKTYTVSEDVSYRISTEDGEYQWRYTTEEYAPPAAEAIEVTLSQTVKRNWWYGFEICLEGTDLAVGPKNTAITVDGQVLIDGVAAEDPQMTVSGLSWGTDSYYVIINTYGLWADQAAYNADQAAGTVHTLTVKAGTRLTTQDGKTYVVTADATYQISGSGYKWSYQEASVLRKILRNIFR